MDSHHSRRQFFKIISGAAALAISPQLAWAGLDRCAVLDATGSLLLKDGSYVSIADFPDLAEYLLRQERVWLDFLRSPMAVVLEGDDVLAQTALADYQPIKSGDGLSVRLPLVNVPPSQPEFTKGANGEWVQYRIEYKHFIQAKRDDTDVPIGVDVIVRNVICDTPQAPN